MTATEILVKYSVGCPFIIHPEAPLPIERSPEFLASVFYPKNKVREEWITREQAARNCERFIVAMEYDMNHAPQTTNAKQLEEINVILPTLDMIAKMKDGDIPTWLWDIIYGLARLGIFLTNTNGMSDRDLLIHLCSKVLQDKVSDIPPTPDMNEFLDMMSFSDGFVDRDRILPRPDRSLFDRV